MKSEAEIKEKIKELENHATILEKNPSKNLGKLVETLAKRVILEWVLEEE